jgi:hypothetical protein
MKAFGKILVVAFYLTTALFADCGHSHSSIVSTDRIGGFFNHNCGAHEVHRPLDSIDFCFICYQLSTSNSLVNSFTSRLSLQHAAVVSSPVLEHLTTGFCFPPVGRAPPQFS